MKTACFLIAIGLATAGFQSAPKSAPKDTREIHRRLSLLSTAVTTLRAKSVDPALIADVDIYRKAAEYILRFPEEFATKAFTPNTMAVLDTGLTRARELEAGAPSWPKRKGHVVRAYVSQVDGSVQPYGLTIPESYDGTTPVRL